MSDMDYFVKASPESAGIKSSSILDFINALESARLSTHSVIIAKGNRIVFEKYWNPFHMDYLHRQYSVTKSVVALAIGFLLQDGLISLDDPIEKYFSDVMDERTNPLQRRQTIRNMLTMSTALPVQDWFSPRHPDRLKLYFENRYSPAVEGGTLFRYDSSGTFVIGALVERLSGMKFMDYMREKLFDRIGVSREAYCLECPGGHSWTDSALICTSRDILKIARFTLNLGEWEGEQILDRNYVLQAVSKQIDNNLLNEDLFDTQGYGFYIWRTFEDSFSFNGMGCQYAICVPHRDLILIIQGDNQGKTYAKDYIFRSFFSLIVDRASDSPLEEDPYALSLLEKRTEKLELAAASGNTDSAFRKEIESKTFVFGESKSGLKSIRFVFSGDEGVMYYENAQGKKKLAFGMGRNVFSEFEQDGYSDRVGSQPGNRRYKCAASAVWQSEKSLLLKVQIIDTYFGNFNALFSFGNGSVSVEMEKHAEDFLEEYKGRAYGTAAET